MGNRHIMRIDLTSAAIKALGNTVDRLGMTQKATISKLVEWFAAQDGVVQGAILDQFPAEIRPDIGKLVLEKMSQRK